MIEAGVLERVEPDGEPRVSLAHLFDAHSVRLYRLARRLSRTREEAEDLVQETFLRAAGAHQHLPAGGAAEEAWLVRVLVNVARDGWRRAKVRAPLGAHGPADPPGPDPERAYVARLAVEAALARLAPRRRAIVVLHELDGLETGAIARLLGISAVTVRWHLSRARRELAEVLGSDS